MLKYFGFALMGLSVDVAIFHMLVQVFHLPIVLSNITSSLTAITLVYVTSNRFLFDRYKFSVYKYVAWVVYQTCSILFFSFMINLIVHVFHIHPTLSKMLIVPVSFVVNYMFLSIIISFGAKDRRQVNTVNIG